MKARFPGRRAWKLGKSEQPLKKSDRRQTEQERFANKAAECFHTDPANLFRRETKPRNFCAGFSMLHIEFEFRNRRIDLRYGQPQEAALFRRFRSLTIVP